LEKINIYILVKPVSTKDFVNE